MILKIAQQNKLWPGQKRSLKSELDLSAQWTDAHEHKKALLKQCFPWGANVVRNDGYIHYEID